jgi:hypothetical protein
VEERESSVLDLPFPGYIKVNHPEGYWIYERKAQGEGNGGGI